ncbi:hypothetical protein [Thiorhodococcus minor]|uniref:Uncharacterized protein n=1 Tax=Thiorhodococcus minor TaxID=57489 RepID=A0A6M0K8H1_9GAMM|nr:hypothetical protein [Thiorhodococcus minor]NEV65017.1 hypothetical protein [Thiorhodococcus minor]
MPSPTPKRASPPACAHPRDERPTEAADDRDAAKPRPRSMHEDVEVWDGCGSCGAEPYWLEIGAELEGSVDADDEAQARPTGQRASGSPR